VHGGLLERHRGCLLLLWRRLLLENGRLLRRLRLGMSGEALLIEGGG
jgi:hypothetical protein